MAPRGQVDLWSSTFLPSKKKKWKQKKKKRLQAIIGHLEFKNNSCRQTGGQQFFSVFHGPSTLKLFLPALHHEMRLSYTKLFNKKMHKKLVKT